MQPNHAQDIGELFKLYTASRDSIGTHLTQAAERAGAQGELLVASGTDVTVFPGGGRPPAFQCFRLNAKGFIELAAISHLGPALAAIIRMRELDPSGTPWRVDAQRLIKQLRLVREANSAALWRDHISAAWSSRIANLVALIDYACVVTCDYLQTALADESWFTFERFRDYYLEATEPRSPQIPFNHVMIATFCLIALDVAHRMIPWLRDHVLDWEQVMVLIIGQAGRATAGLTWSSNNLCHLLARAAKGRLSPERLYIMPHAPDLSPRIDSSDEPWGQMEGLYRTLWFNAHVNVELAGRMFEGHPPYRFKPPRGETVDRRTDVIHELPVVTSAEDVFGLVSRLRFVLEDPRQLISNCVADLMIDQLCANDCQPENVRIPGFSDVAYADATFSGY